MSSESQHGHVRVAHTSIHWLCEKIEEDDDTSILSPDEAASYAL